MQYCQKILLVTLLSFHLFACQNSKSPVVETTVKSVDKEVKLGGSNYYLKLPNGFEISEARGKEGQLGYNIIPRDTSSKMYGFIEIEPGRPVGESHFKNENSKVYKRSTFLNEEFTWEIYQTETKFFVAYTQKGNISANATASKEGEIDSLIAIVATLTNK